MMRRSREKRLRCSPMTGSARGSAARRRKRRGGRGAAGCMKKGSAEPGRKVSPDEVLGPENLVAVLFDHERAIGRIHPHGASRRQVDAPGKAAERVGYEPRKRRAPEQRPPDGMERGETHDPGLVVASSRVDPDGGINVEERK